MFSKKKKKKKIQANNLKTIYNKKSSLVFIFKNIIPISFHGITLRNPNENTYSILQIVAFLIHLSVWS